MMDGWRMGRVDGGFGLTQFFGPSPEPVAINDGEFDEWHFFLPPGWRAFNQASLEEVCAFQWIIANRMALDAKRDIPPSQWIQIRYEEILERPVEIFRDIFERLGIPFDERLHAYCESIHRRPTSMVAGPPVRQKWRTRNPEAVTRMLARIRPMMQELGYDPEI